jgi:citrate lyase subunit beta/citryl-CoA lyase
MLQKARGLPCDVVVLDLEDAVAPEMKDAARAAAIAALPDFPGRAIVVRINPLSSPYGHDDLAAMRAARPAALLLPKVESHADVTAAKIGLPLWAMIETPRGVMNLSAIAAGGVEALVLGANDLLQQMHAQPLADRRNLWMAMSQIVMAARAHGLSAIDATYNALHDAAGFAASCAQGRAFGFDGKSLIHPSQIQACNAAFAPSAEELARARAILAAFAAEPGTGAIALDGAMIERLHAQEASRLLALADAIAERGA